VGTREEKIRGLEEMGRVLISTIDENPSREGLKDTPLRYAKFMVDFTSRLGRDFKLTMFPAEGAQGMILVKDMPFYSLCEHHMIPFFGTAAIAYFPDKHIVGLSKLPRMVEFFGHGLQNQERITKQIITDLLSSDLKPLGVAVHIKATHLCMAMRGVESAGATTETTEYSGKFLYDNQLQQQFLDRLQ
jgi:GTP cyclohydrolase I